MKSNQLILVLICVFALTSCMRSGSSSSSNSKISSTTGWKYNNSKNGGFETNNKFKEQITGPGLVFVEGGSFTMGRVEQDVMYEWNNVPRKVTVSSFYLDETEVRNVDYLEYLYWLQRTYSMSYPEVYKKALPDTLVWRDKLGYNEPFVTQYLRHPAYQNYPVVGVSWAQANDYCLWRTDRVNERILINEGILKEDFEQVDENTFNTEAYLAGQYEGIVRKNPRNLNPTTGEKTRQVRLEDGLLLPKYRLATEAEWEFAALGYVGNTIDQEENRNERKLYPWNGSSLRNGDKKNQGEIMANFKRGRGDNMGVAGNLNDNADITAPVRTYWPNDYGLYNMAGNVSEWVMDVYRAEIEQTTISDHRNFRGNVYTTQKTDEDGFLAEKDSLGRMTMVPVDVQDNAYRRNYKKSDNINYNDGDIESQMGIDWNTFLNETESVDTARVKIDKWNQEADKYKDNAKTGNSNEMYAYGEASLVTDRTRVFKGGSWKDRAYWLNPGTRRFLDQDQSTDAIGFRCAMDRVGAPSSTQKENIRRGVDYSKKRN
jgi:sulfatase modifying factor 1